MRLIATVRLVTFTLLALGAAACVEAPPDTDVVFLPPLPPPDCEDWGCTGNTPVMGEAFHELHEQGLPNDAGFVLDGLWQGGVRYRPNVTGARLVGIAPGQPLLASGALTGAYFRVLDEQDQEWRIYIENVSTYATYWLRPGTQKVQTYHLRTLSPGGSYPEDLRDLCNRPPTDSQVGDANVWPTLTEAVLFAGDRYDPVTKQVIASTPSEAGDWFNIGCAGSALAKLHFNRFTAAGATSTWLTTRDQRNDLLAMYTGNVCGTGRSFTQPGVPIRWGVDSGQRAIEDWGGIDSYEAVWGGGRAQCLDTWRLPPADVPLETIAAECTGAGVPVPPPCASLSGWPAGWAAHGTIQSGTP